MDGVRIWDLATGRQIKALGGKSQGTYALAICPDGKRLITGGEVAADRIRVWDLSTGDLLMSARGDSTVVNRLAVSPDGHTFATSGWDGNVYLWKMENGLEFIETPLGEPVGRQTVSCLAFSPDGKLLAAGGNGGKVYVWEVGSEKEPRIIEAHKDWVHSIAFAPGGKGLVSAGGHYEGKGRSARQVRLWDATTGEKLLEYDVEPGDSVAAVAFSPDGQTLASVGAGSVVLWDAATGRKTRTLQGREAAGSAYHGSGVAFSPGGRLLATIGPGDVITLWDVTTGGPLFQDPEGNVTPVSCVAYSPDGSQFAACADAISVWDAAAGRRLRVLQGHEVYDVAFSPDGKLLASGSGGLDGSVRLWDWASGEEIRKFPGQEWVQACRVAFSPDGNLLAALYRRETLPGIDVSNVRLWRVGTGEQLLELGPVDGAGWLLAFSPDGSMLACACRGSAPVFSWDLPAGTERPPFDVAGQPPWKPVGLSNDAGIVVDFDRGSGAVRFWELATGRMIRSISVPGERVWRAAFSGHNDLVAVPSMVLSAERLRTGPRVLRVLDAATGRELVKFDTKEDGSVLAAAFSPDGKRLVTGMSNTTILVWDLSSAK